jgi:hypothetical protein
MKSTEGNGSWVLLATALTSVAAPAASRSAVGAVFAAPACHGAAHGRHRAGPELLRAAADERR